MVASAYRGTKRQGQECGLMQTEHQTLDFETLSDDRTPRSRADRAVIETILHAMSRPHDR